MLCAFLLAQSREQSSCTDRVQRLCTQPLPRRATYHADYMNWRLTCPTPMADVIQPYCTRCQSVVTLTRCKHDVLVVVATSRPHRPVRSQSPRHLVRCANGVNSPLCLSIGFRNERRNPDTMFVAFAAIIPHVMKHAIMCYVSLTARQNLWMTNIL